jgi:hypothetical protein
MNKINVFPSNNMKACVVSHDAGGAEILASYVFQNNLDCFFVLEGPAQKVFERRLGKIRLSKIADVFHLSDWLLCGTSWQSDLEWKAMNDAQKNNKKLVVFLDHWTNYKERFIRDEITITPEELWVGDDIAFEKASLIFPKSIIKVVENPYFKDVIKDIRTLRNSSSYESSNMLSILYVCEPIGEHALKEHGDDRYWGYNEYDALRYFLDNISVLEKPIKKVVIRPHPSEQKGKYQWVSEEYGDFIEHGGKKTLLEEISENNVIVGCETMAMVIGILSGNRVISCIPPGKKICTLPQQEIEHWHEIIKK